MHRSTFFCIQMVWPNSYRQTDNLEAAMSTVRNAGLPEWLLWVNTGCVDNPAPRSAVGA